MTGARTSVGLRRLRLALLTVAALAQLAFASGAWAAEEAPIKEKLLFHFGWNVNSTGGTVCDVDAEPPECRAEGAQFSSKAGGFEFVESVAGAPGGNVYVADGGNHRVQELEADGAFVLTFGRGVNKEGDDLCKKSEESKCQAGKEGMAPGEFQGLESVAVDPATGDVWTAERPAVLSGGKVLVASRVQEFTSEGQFIREIGKEVNETAHINKETAAENFCPVNPGDKCGAPSPTNGSEPGAFNLGGSGSLLAVENGELYVGDELRVQIFDASAGTFLEEIQLPGRVEAVAVDKAGYMYMIESANDYKIRLFDPSHKPVTTFAQPAVASQLAIDAAGRLAVVEDVTIEHTVHSEGTLYERVGTELHPITHFRAEGQGLKGIAFNESDELFGASFREVLAYVPVRVASLKNEPPSCGSGEVLETDATFDCQLTGLVNPWGVAETMAWFRWGTTKVPSEETVHEPVAAVETPVEVKQLIVVRPNQLFYFQFLGEDANSKPETLSSQSLDEGTTPTVPPRIIDELIASFQTPTTAVLFGRLNPENAPTSYRFEYALESECSQGEIEEGKSLDEACRGVLVAGKRESSEYGRIGTVTEVTGLRPSTTYRYRLYAINDKAEPAIGESGQSQLPEGTFTTAQPTVVTAQTGEASAITPTTAQIAGAVNPDGQASTYSFQLGVDRGADTQYATAFTASAGSEAGPVEERFTLTGLQPATTYAYRIAIQFGDGTTPGSKAVGEARTFTTAVLPQEPFAQPPEQLLVPGIKFPRPPVVKKPSACARAHRRHRCSHGKQRHTSKRPKRRH